MSRPEHNQIKPNLTTETRIKNRRLKNVRTRHGVWGEDVYDWNELIREAEAIGDFELAWSFRILARLDRQTKEERRQVSEVPARPPKRERPKCGAMTRKGTPCQAPAVWLAGEPAPRNGRCRMHGGLSTGPKTEAGKEAIRESNRRRARKT